MREERRRCIAVNASPKRRYIEATYNLLKREGLDGITIRKVASEAGCTSGAIYKHFKDANELIAVASVRYLRDYAEDARTLSKVDLNPLELNLQLWECFAFYSFTDAPIFENLFFSLSEAGYDTTNAVDIYYECFPEEIQDQKGFIQEMFSGATMFERDSILLKQAAQIGALTEESARYLCTLDTYLFRGMLASVRGTYQDPLVARATTRDFMRLLVRGYESQLNPGYSILVVKPFSPSLNLDQKLEGSQAYQVVIPMAAGKQPKTARRSG